MDREITLGGKVTYLTPNKPKEAKDNVKQIQPGYKLRGTYEGYKPSKKPGMKGAYLVKSGEEIFGFNSSGKLAALVEKANIRSGDEITIIYKGKSPIQAGPYKGTEAHDYGLTVHSSPEQSAPSEPTKKALPF